MTVNRRIVLKAHPNGVPVPADFAMDEVEVRPLQDGEILIRNHFFSMEPAIRGWLDGKANYFAPLLIGDPIRCPTIGKVVESRHPDFQPGDTVRGLNNWEDYSILNKDTILLEKVNPAPGMPLSYYVGPLGGSGLTAYVGLHDIGQIKAGETVVISAGVGAVGSVASQVAKLRGCRVVGIVGGTDKAKIALETMGYDAVIDYKNCSDLAAAIRETCPEGVDVYFDNVGGPTLDAMLINMKTFGRVIGCGMIAGYNNQDAPPPIFNMWELVSRQLMMKGFLLFAYADSIPAALKQLEAWIASGEIKVIENKMVGLANAPVLFSDLMGGRTIGKSVLEVDLI